MFAPFIAKVMIVARVLIDYLFKLVEMCKNDQFCFSSNLHMGKCYVIFQGTSAILTLNIGNGRDEQFLVHTYFTLLKSGVNEVS